MSASGAVFKKTLNSEQKLITSSSSYNKNNIEFNVSDSTEEIQIDYIQLADNSHEHLVEIKNETRSTIEYSLSDIAKIKQQLQACKIPLKKNLDPFLWYTLGGYSIAFGISSIFISGWGAGITYIVGHNSHLSEIVGYVFLGCVTSLGTGCLAVLNGAMNIAFALKKYSYPFPIIKKSIYPPLDTLLTIDQINEIATVVNTINTNLFTIQIAENENSTQVFCKLNQAEKKVEKIEIEIKATNKASGFEVLKTFKYLNKNGFFAHNASSETPDPIRKTTLEYIIPEESVINSLVSPRKKRGFC